MPWGDRGAERKQRGCKGESSSASRDGLAPVLSSEEKSMHPLFTSSKPNWFRTQGSDTTTTIQLQEWGNKLL